MQMQYDSDHTPDFEVREDSSEGGFVARAVDVPCSAGCGMTVLSAIARAEQIRRAWLDRIK